MVVVFQVHVDVSEGEGEGVVDNRIGTFVMYNCARLATLLHSFEQQVEQGEESPFLFIIIMGNLWRPIL